MEEEGAEKEGSEGVEHFNEEVPPETDVWRKIWEENLNAVRGREKVP